VLRSTDRRVRALAISLMTATLIAALAVPLAPVAEPNGAESVAATGAAPRVIALARAQLGDPWRYGASGPNAFDCSGLVTYAFRQAGQLARIGGGSYRSASSLYAYFSRRGLASRRDGRVGDLVIYGGGSHVGIYLGAGRVISTLTSGVRIHGTYALYQGFTAFLHTGISGRVASTAPAARSHGRRSKRHQRTRRQRAPLTRALHQPTFSRVIPTWTGVGLGPTAAIARLGAADFERMRRDPAGTIVREVRHEAGRWRAAVAAQDGVTDARIDGIAGDEPLTTIRVGVGNVRAWLELGTPGGRRTWVASARTRR
jgi:hypothetical protein